MALRAILTEPKCLVCSSPRRAELDEWIGRLGEKDDRGQVIVWERIVEDVAPLLLGYSVSKSSLKRHRATHCEVVEAEDGPTGGGVPEPAWEDEELAALIEHIANLANAERVSPSALLEVQSRLWLMQTRQRLSRGERVTITADGAARAAALLAKGEHEAAESELLKGVAGAIGSYVGKALVQSAAPALEPAIEGEAVEDAEVVEVAVP